MRAWPCALTASLAAGSAAAAELSIFAVDGEGRATPLAATHASLERTPPRKLSPDPAAPDGDPDALRYLVAGPSEALPSLVDLRALDEDGQPLSVLAGVPLAATLCPAVAARPETRCAVTPPIRVVADEIDAHHPLVRARSIPAVLGGALALELPGGPVLGALRVAGPRRSVLGPIERYRARLRVVLVRLAPGGAPPVGLDDAGAVEAARSAVDRATSLWGACGIGFGPARELDVRVVDPPPAHLLAVGCDAGVPSSGGLVRVRAAGRTVVTRLEAGMRPAEAARRIAGSLRQAGLRARVWDNPRTASGADGTSDVSVTLPSGALADLEPVDGGPVSTDATLRVCIGFVNLEDGLQHFGDVDAMAGTVEERTLVKAYEDGDPTTIEVFVVPGFSRGGRIGESFIFADRGAIRNVVVIDRAAVRSTGASATLAHELGHVLLDDPGHPDDFGSDTPTSLMDADAANPTAFGPRRLSLAECERVFRQSGPAAPLPLLALWPLAPLPALR
jgi:hypothetical protein